MFAGAEVGVEVEVEVEVGVKVKVKVKGEGAFGPGRVELGWPRTDQHNNNEAGAAVDVVGC